MVSESLKLTFNLLTVFELFINKTNLREFFSWVRKNTCSLQPALKSIAPGLYDYTLQSCKVAQFFKKELLYP